MQVFLLDGKFYKEVYQENVAWIWSVGAWPAFTHLGLQAVCAHQLTRADVNQAESGASPSTRL